VPRLSIRAMRKTSLPRMGAGKRNAHPRYTPCLHPSHDLLDVANA